MGKCYTLAPSFRAEKSRTRRHLTEYWHLEVEIPFCGLEGLLKVIEEFITHFPKAAKAFYHKPDPRRPEVTLSADLLAPEGYGEIIGGGERIDDYETLLARIREEGLDPADYEWYLDLRKYGSVQHSGFGLGVERMVMWVCKLEHIRDAIAFPRLVRRRPYP